MPFTENDPNINRNGRPHGARNKMSEDRLDKINALLEKLDQTIDQDLKSLSPKDRVDIYVKLLEFTTPKLQRLAVPVELQSEPLFKPATVIIQVDDK